MSRGTTAASLGASRPTRGPAANGQGNADTVKPAGFVEPQASSPADRQGGITPEVIPTPDEIDAGQAPDQAKLFGPPLVGAAEGPWGTISQGQSDVPCGPCIPRGVCAPYDDGGEGCALGFYGCIPDFFHRISLFGGIQGFKGPLDVGQNGNFGIHEGVNFGAPLGDPWDYGFQLGFQAVQSNFSGFQINTPDNTTLAGPQTRRQFFFTGGLFRRVEYGLQWGAAFDYMHDTYYRQTDLQQVRSETGYVFGQGNHELGYWGAYGVNSQRLQIGVDKFVFLQPNDVFAGFYRRRFTGGGMGRIWAGGTGAGQGIIGGEATVPLGTSWSLENNFVYVIPKSSAANGGLREETWSVTISLVWYPGRVAQTVFRDPYQPFLSVGDNSAMLIRR